VSPSALLKADREVRQGPWDYRWRRNADRGGRPGAVVADSNHERGSGFSGLLAADGVSVMALHRPTGCARRNPVMLPSRDSVFKVLVRAFATTAK
jgi:hypothetical protein